MEEKQLNAQQSLELITRMIGNTRRNLERNSGRPFLIWGYTTVAITLLNYWFKIEGFHPGLSLTWFAIIPVGYLLTKLFPARKNTEPRTETDRMVSSVWEAASLAIIPIFALCIFHGFFRSNVFTLVSLTMAIATTATGLIVRSHLYTIAGCMGMAGTILIAVQDWHIKLLARSGAELSAEQMHAGLLIFAAIFIVMMIIPGHIINYRSRRTEN